MFSILRTGREGLRELLPPGGFAGGPGRAPGAHRAEARRERGGNISRRLEISWGHSGPSGGHPRRGGTADATPAPGRACPTPVGPPWKAKLFFRDVHIIKQQYSIGIKTTWRNKTTGTTKEKETYHGKDNSRGRTPIMAEKAGQHPAADAEPGKIGAERKTGEGGGQDGRACSDRRGFVLRLGQGIKKTGPRSGGGPYRFFYCRNIPTAARII